MGNQSGMSTTTIVRSEREEGVVRLRLKIRRCQNLSCERYRIAYRPEQEGKWALPQQEFGLDVIALVGALRYQEHRSVPQIHQQLCS